MKKLLVCVLAVSLALGLAGCGGAAGANAADVPGGAAAPGAAPHGEVPEETPAETPEGTPAETPEGTPGETGEQLDAVVQAERDEQARLEREAEEAAMGGEWGIPAGQHEGIRGDNMVTVLLQELVPMPDREMYLFMKDGAVHSDVLPSAEYLLKPYTLGALDGMLSAGFGGPADTAVTADNAKKVPELTFYLRGAGRQDYEYTKACFEEYGVAFWSGSRQQDNEPASWDDLPKNTEYSLTGTFEYGGATYKAVLYTLTERDEPYFYEDFEAALGEGWPLLMVTLLYHGQ